MTFPGNWPVPASGWPRPGLARAQGGPVEGQHYVQLSTPAPVSAAHARQEGRGRRILLVRLPALLRLRALLDSWAKRLPADVAFRQVPVGFAAAAPGAPEAVLRAGGDGPAAGHAPQGLRRHPPAEPAPEQRSRHRGLRRRQRRGRRQVRRRVQVVQRGHQGQPGQTVVGSLQDRRRAGARHPRPLLHFGLAGRQPRAGAGGDRLPDPARAPEAPDPRAWRGAGRDVWRGLRRLLSLRQGTWG